jgi:hypothetical protein
MNKYLARFLIELRVYFRKFYRVPVTNFVLN